MRTIFCPRILAYASSIVRDIGAARTKESHMTMAWYPERKGIDVKIGAGL